MTRDLTRGNPMKLILGFGVPLLFGYLFQQFYSVVDTAIVGKTLGGQALAAVGSTGALINLIVTLFMGISVGANVLVSQYYGAGDKKGLHETVHTAILSSLVFGIALIAVGIALARPMLEMMETPADVLEQAVLYMRIYFIGMPVLMLYNFGAAILRAVGDTQRPLYFLLLAGVVNVVLNLFFVIVLHMGVAGVAAATSISQAVSAFLVFWCLVKVDGDYKLYPKQMRIYKDKLWKMMKIGLPAGIQGASFSISNVLIQSSINSFGAVAMAGNTAGANIEGFVNMGMDSFSQAALSFTGQNLGAGKTKRVNRVMVLCLLMASATGLLLGLTANLFGPQLLGIYSSDSAVIEYGLMRLRITCMFQFAGGLMGVMVGVLRGMGASLIPMAITISSVCGFRVVWIFTVFAASPTLTTLYVSYPVTWALAAFFDFVCFFFVKRGAEKKQQLRQQPQG